MNQIPKALGRLSQKKGHFWEKYLIQIGNLEMYLIWNSEGDTCPLWPKRWMLASILVKYLNDILLTGDTDTRGPLVTKL